MQTNDYKLLASRIFRIFPDSLWLNKLYLKLIYRLGMKRGLNFDNVKSLNEKMQYIKLYDKNELYTQIADKVKVRDFVADRIGEKYLIPMLKHGTNIDEITSSNLPELPFILKANHDCSGGLIIRDLDRKLLNVKGVSVYENHEQISTKEWNVCYIKYFLSQRFKYNHYYITKEWQYKNIQKQYLFEALLEDSSGHVPNDYKFHCINGKVEFIYVSIDREGSNNRKIYYPDWTEAPFTWTKIGREYKFAGGGAERPSNLNEMIEVAEKLAAGFKYIRVDLYSDNNQIFFGELTLQQGSGIEPILPLEYDYYYGDKLSLI